MAQGRPTLKLLNRPGIQRDGTQLSTNLYTDGKWVRFYRGLPKKIGGYSRMDTVDTVDGVMRHLYVYPNRDTVLIYYFTKYEQGASVTGVDLLGSGSKYEMTCDATPIGEFVWSVDTMFDALGSGTSVIVAHPGDNIQSLDNNRQTPVFFKDASDTAANFAPVTITDATSTTGDMTAADPTLDVADATGFSVGELVRVVGAGTNFSATVTAINGLVVTVDGRIRVAAAAASAFSGTFSAAATASAGDSDITLSTVTGLNVGDTLTIEGCGGDDLYATIVSINLLELTLDTPAINTVTGAAVTHVLGTDGGIVVLGQYLVTYGSNGRITNSNVNAPQQYDRGDANEANIVGTKIVKGLPMRSGGGGSTSGLFWSTDSLIRMSYTGGGQVFRYDVLSSQSSILASNSVIEYDGRYYWIGVDRFLMFAGSIQEVPNPVNQDDFFDNLNFTHRQKIWATKVPRYGEIWWFYPRGENTECSHAIIFNVRENTWYDAELTRSAGYYSQVFRYPVWSDGSQVWFHEQGSDKVSSSGIESLESYFVTRNLGLPIGSGPESPTGIDQWQRITRIEPDFILSGQMRVNVLTREYAQSDDVEVESKVFDGDTGKIDIRVQARFLRLKFISNDTGGNYQCGSTMIYVEPGDVRQ